MERRADISNCQNYRYSLERIWDNNKPLVAFIGLNPSTADQTVDDNTIRRCINFAKSWGAGGIYMVNLFAYRATSPANMLKQDDPIGPENDEYLSQLPNKVEKIIACWGNLGSYQGRSNQVKDMLKTELFCLGLNKTGEPKHPLYIKSSAELIPFG